MKKLALTGAKGMLGSDLLKSLEKSYTCFPVDIEELDITDKGKVMSWLRKIEPEILVNAAAYTDVDGCETHQDLAMQVNGEGVGSLAEGCSRLKVMMVHISTDFVFDGCKADPYTEEDTPKPLSVYGASKLLGEQRLMENLERFLIVRTSWLYGLGGRNFVEAILRKAEDEKHLRVVDDQRGSPTYVPDLSHALIRLLLSDASGIAHVSNSGSCSWFEFAQTILALSGKDQVTVDPIPSSELDRPAQRPANSVLSCERYVKMTGNTMRHWKDGLKAYLQSREERYND
jgi:dTDP-4-dehydrorhamnose reductase